LDNIDTDYKRELMDFLSRGRWRRALEVRDGLDLRSDQPDFQYVLVLMRDWKAELPKLIAGADPNAHDDQPVDGRTKPPAMEPLA